MFRKFWGQGNDYDPNNEKHQQQISAQIKKTRDTFASLAKVDATIGAALSLETYLIMSGWLGSWGPWASLPAYVATAKGIAATMDRASKVDAFVAARNELFHTYHWCMDSQGAAATQDPMVLRVLKTLQPFMQSRGALIPEKMQSHMNDIPGNFKKLLDACPEDGRRVWPHAADQTLMEAMDEVFSDITVIQVATYIEKQGNDWAKFFSQAAANAIRLGYGDTMDQQVQAPRNN